MFPNVLFKEEHVKNKLKERQWDERITNKANDSGLKNNVEKGEIQKIDGLKSYKKMAQSTPKLQIGKQTNADKKSEMLDRIKALHKDYVAMITAYQEECKKQKIPNSFVVHNLRPLLSMQDPVAYLFNESKQLKECNGHFHIITAAITARQECISAGKKIFGALNIGSEGSNELPLLKKDEGVAKRQTNELIQSHKWIEELRDLTSNVIECIRKWRNYLGESDQMAVFEWKGKENYLMKLLNDNHFIFNSRYSRLISFAQKNDPFVVVPLRPERSMPAKNSAFYLGALLQVSQPLVHYQRHMQYLAREKAYDSDLHRVSKAKQSYKNPSVQRIYRPSLPAPKDDLIVYQKPDDDKLLELQKMREDRLKKNQERIKSIKNIYDAYTKKNTKERKVQTDNQGINQKMYKKPTLADDQSDFDVMVQNNLNRQKQIRGQKIKQKTLPLKIEKSIQKKEQIKQKKIKSPAKPEEKTIEQLKSIQWALQSKLRNVREEKEGSNEQYRYIPRSNEDLVKELKAQILGKLEKQTQEKQKIRRKKREDEEKALQQIKNKLKKQMQEKLEQKKKEKMLQREQLQKKLKQEEQRLNSQKQLELQLQLKLSKEKQLRELQKIKRQSLERQKRFKEELQKEQQMRREREKTIQTERKQKQRLIQELKKKEIKEQIEDELKSQMRGSQATVNGKSQMNMQAFRGAKQAQLSKELELLKSKQATELELLTKENELRERMLRLRRDEEELKRKELDQVMKTVIQQEKEQLSSQAMRKRIQIEQQMRNGVKERMLEEYRDQKFAQVQKHRVQREQRLQEDVYREKVRERLERQMRMEAIERTKREMDQREQNKYQVRKQLQNVKEQIVKENNLAVKKNRIQQEVKRELIQTVIFDKQAEKEAAKNDLRLQFERELLASAVPQLYEQRESFLLKDTVHLQKDSYLDNKLASLQPTNIRPTAVSPSPTNQKPLQLKSTLTREQLSVYQKQKEVVSDRRLNSHPTNFQQTKDDGFQILSFQQNPTHSTTFIPKQSSLKPSNHKKIIDIQQEKSSSSAKRKKKLIDSSSKKISSKLKYKEDQLLSSFENKKNKKKRKLSSDSELKESDSSEPRKRKRKEKKKKKEQSSQQSEKKQRRYRKKEVNKQSEQQKEQKYKRKEEKEEDLRQKKEERKKQIQRDEIKMQQRETVMVREVKAVGERMRIEVEALVEDELDEYLEVHLSRLPQSQRISQVLEREAMYRRLTGELTFCLLVGWEEGKSVGIALVYHDRDKVDSRNMVIVHIGTYRNDHFKDFLLSVTAYIFRKDPCDQIQLHLKYDESKPEELTASTQFNKWFDKYGNVFQKKLEDSTYQRKYCLRRLFNQKCEVLLGGVNKNSFRNLFAVYCGVVMSETDLLQVREEMEMESLRPENKISYAVMVAEMFRTFLTPDEAESLKSKVKQFVKLKQLLVLVVMLQKKKVKMEQIKLSEFHSVVQLNMKLMSQGREVIRYAKDSSESNRVYYSELAQSYNLPFQFQTTSLPVEAGGVVRQVSYFRLSPLPPQKLHTVKSTLYNGELHILPTENSKYKIFVLAAQEFAEVKDQPNLDLFMYVRLFLKNVRTHAVAAWKYVWLPEIADKAAWPLREFRSFLNKDFYAHDSLHFSYRQFLPAALIINPQHRDLVLTPPFILGLLSMNLEQVSEGSPLYARLIDIQAVKTIEIQRS